MASQFTYDANGNMASQTDALGRTTSYTYNSLGQKIIDDRAHTRRLQRPPRPPPPTQYDAFGNLTQTAAPLGRVTSSHLRRQRQQDLRHRCARQHHATTSTTPSTGSSRPTIPTRTNATKTYDFRNNVVTETDQAGNVTQPSIRPGRPPDLGHPGLRHIERHHHQPTPTTTPAARPAETDALGHVTTYTYDAAGNLTCRLRRRRATSSYAYDNARNRDLA